MLPNVVEEVPSTAVLVQCRVMTVAIAEYLHVFLCFLSQKLAKVSKISISRQQTKTGELVFVSVFHGFHDNGNVDLCLHLQVEARLAYVALLIGAKNLFAFEGSDVDTEAK